MSVYNLPSLINTFSVEDPYEPSLATVAGLGTILKYTSLWHVQRSKEMQHVALAETQN